MLTGGRQVDVGRRLAPKALRLLAFTVLVLGTRHGFGQSSAEGATRTKIPLPRKVARKDQAPQPADLDRLLAACKETHIPPPHARRSPGSKGRERPMSDVRMVERTAIPMPNRPHPRDGGRPLAR